MDLTSPLRSLVPTLESEVLRVLAQTESGLGPTQIARLAARGTRPGLQKALDRLIDHGLVAADRTNKGYVYWLNRDHVLMPALTAALGARQVLIDRLSRGVAALSPRPAHVALFGSFARGGGTDESDIDLLVVVDDEQQRHSEEWQAGLRDLEDGVLAWTGNSLEPLVFSRETLASAIHAQEPIIEALRGDSIRLLGVSFAELVHEVVSRTKAGSR